MELVYNIPGKISEKRIIFRHNLNVLKNEQCGTSLAVQWLRLRLPMQGVWVRSLVRELRSHMPCGQKTKT